MSERVCTRNGCSQFALPEFTRCQYHLDCDRKNLKRSQERKKAKGLCVSCSRQAMPNRSLCSYHIEKMHQYDEERREKAKITGRCTKGKCNEPVVPDRLFCMTHLEIGKNRGRKHYADFVSRRLCRACGEVSKGKPHCESCLKLSIEERRQKEQARNETGICVYCGGPAERPLFIRNVMVSCQKCRTARSYSPTIGARFNRAYRNYVNKIGWTLTLKEYSDLVIQPCFYCQLSEPLESGTGLDRINITRGYHLDNVVPCCCACNVARSSLFTVDEMKLIGAVIRKIRLARMMDRDITTLTKTNAIALIAMQIGNAIERQIINAFPDEIKIPERRKRFYNYHGSSDGTDTAPGEQNSDLAILEAECSKCVEEENF